MSTPSHHPRPARPDLPTGRVVLEPPPQLQPRDGGGVLMNALPMLGSLGSVALVASMGRANGGRGLIAAGLFLASALGFVVVQLDRQRRQRTEQVAGPRGAYLRYLAGERETVRAAADQQRRALTWRHPDPAALPALAGERSRVWEVGASDPDHLHVRYGRGMQPLSVDLVGPDRAPGDQADPVAASAMRRLLAVHRLQPELPAVVDLRAVGRVEVCGPEEPARALARSLLCSAAAFHPPERLAIAVVSSERHLAHWDWVKWLPHARSCRRSDAVGPMRLVSTSLEGLTTLLAADAGARSAPHLLVVVDGVDLPPDVRVPPTDEQGVTVVDLPARWEELHDPARLRIRLDDGPGGRDARPALVLRRRERPVQVLADQCSTATAEALARRLAPLAPLAAGGAGHEVGAAAPAGLLDLLALGPAHDLEPTTAWRPRPDRDRLRVPIGVREDGSAVHLDLKESAQQGMGPHGLVIGATGSGKSELLRTLVLGLTLTHAPDQLNLVLVDFKGGATFAGMAPLPHVSAIITNLAQELTLVDRMQDALTGELVRRQELLRRAGNLASVRDYERARLSGADLTPLPSLLIVVDEFSELLAAKPEFIDLFVAIGRLGRSLGLHLLLASQRLEEGRLRGLESHLSYRIALRTFSAAESRTVLGVPDAYELPAAPGLGLLKPDPATLVRFQATYVSGPPPSPPRRPRHEDDHAPGILPFPITEVPTSEVPAAEPRTPDPLPAETRPPDDGASTLDVAVRRMAGHGPAAHQVWLPPLDVPDTLGGLMPDLTVDPGLGLVSPRWRGLGRLVVPLGTIDRPREQRRETLVADLSGSAGHVGVVGGPRSGKSTLLRTLVTGLALTTTPEEVQVFVLDFGGGALAPLAGLPHVAGVGGRSEPEVVRRVVAEVRGILDRRETYFRDHGIDSVETYRSRRAAGGADDGYGDVFLVVDGWSTLRAEFDDLEVELQQLAGRGLTFGLHLVVGATRWADLRAATRDLLGTRLELRLGDPLDSEVDRAAAALVPAGRPGRGLLPGRLHFLAALPRIDGSAGHDDPADDLADGVADLVGRVAAAWTGPAGPRLRLLPRLVTLEEVRALAEPAPGDRRLLLGLEEAGLGPLALDADAEPHLLLFGEGRSGRSGVLRAFAREVMRTRTPEEAQLVVVDYRRSLLGDVPEEYLLHHLTSATQAQPAIRELADHLQSRMPGPGVTPGQLRDRSWWSGAEVFVLVDDYDLVTTSQGSPVQALLPLLPQARDVGLHLVVARRAGGASRALYEPVIQSLRDLAAPGLLLSGSPDEGPLIGHHRPQPAAPGRGRLVTRERGVEVVQMAWCEPGP